jgi:phosphinothricin acetyltransferase
MSRIEIRPADPGADSGRCAEIYAPYVEEGGTSFEESPPGPEEMARRIAACSASHAWLVAEQEGGVVGFAYGGPHRARPAYRWSAEVSVYVDSERRRRGAGAALYAVLLDRLRERGFHVACAGITLPNEASVALHERLGFEPVGVYREIGWKQGAWHDVGWWQLILTPDASGPPPEPV